MKKKSYSKPMREILSRLKEFEYLSVIIFDEEVILNEPVEQWPLCDYLISFHSSGFPLSKAEDYVALRQPFVVNDLTKQHVLQSRPAVYELLVGAGIPVPRYAVLDRTDDCDGALVEEEDRVTVNGECFEKPFVEKPVCAEDHNVNIYFSKSEGGGCQRLFRKIDNRSSDYSSESRVRKQGSFIYEEFLKTGGKDIKVYTVGPDYVYAEARKSPGLDGKVERTREGKEVRYPVILSSEEKSIAKKICLAFKQTVCGFDLLRTSEKSYVCDVNGFSFVKNNSEYYDNCASVLANLIQETCLKTSKLWSNIRIPIEDVILADVRKNVRLNTLHFKTERNLNLLRPFLHLESDCMEGLAKSVEWMQLQQVSTKRRYSLCEVPNCSAPDNEEIEKSQRFDIFDQMLSAVSIRSHGERNNGEQDKSKASYGHTVGNVQSSGPSLVINSLKTCILNIADSDDRNFTAFRLSAVNSILKCLYFESNLSDSTTNSEIVDDILSSSTFGKVQTLKSQTPRASEGLFTASPPSLLSNVPVTTIQCPPAHKRLQPSLSAPLLPTTPAKCCRA